MSNASREIRRRVGQDALVEDFWREFDVAVGRWRLGELRVERLPDAAMHALLAGCETPSLAQLAAMAGSGSSEIERLLARVLKERERRLPSKDDAVKAVADDLVRQMVEGEISPEQAVERLLIVSMKALSRPAWKDLGVFHHLALDWEIAEEAPQYLDELRIEILRQGRELFERGGVRLS